MQSLVHTNYSVSPMSCSFAVTSVYCAIFLQSINFMINILSFSSGIKECICVFKLFSCAACMLPQTCSIFNYLIRNKTIKYIELTKISNVNYRALHFALLNICNKNKKRYIISGIINIPSDVRGQELKAGSWKFRIWINGFRHLCNVCCQ